MGASINQKPMNDENPIDKIVESFGLTVERVAVPEYEEALRIHKGAKQIFLGTEADARDFLVQYEQERPELYAGSIYGYKE
jgi:hypothetical protein